MFLLVSGLIPVEGDAYSIKGSPPSPVVLFLLSFTHCATTCIQLCSLPCPAFLLSSLAPLLLASEYN